MALCPVCKTECGNNRNCSICGFEQIGYDFISKEDATKWFEEVVIPFRNQKLINRSDYFIDDNTLMKYNGNKPVVYIPNYIQTIFHGCFSGNSFLCVIIPENINQIFSYSFMYCDKLERIDFSNHNTQVLNIHGLAVYKCSNLKSVYIGKNVVFEDKPFCNAFGACHSIEKIVVDSDHPRYHSSQNCLIEKTTLLFGCKYSVIPDYVTEIGRTSFYENHELSSNIIIPTSITKIGEKAFYGCHALEIIIPITVTIIDKDAFSACDYAKIYCEAIEQPIEWNESWCGNRHAVYDPKVYWKNEWHYENGKPVPNE